MKKALALVVFALLLEGAVLLQLATPALPAAGAAVPMIAQIRPVAGPPASPAVPCRNGGKKC